ncbi:hypothetical protein OZX62_05875 [Bifidobacterium sp. ESL0690]|uniref:hypothetical protein n=1 Tax=Bifidobacterium sp. ESL0690 TaxID=2983214 RepID=UPI0023F621FF|nr:hypothetical protein [Bifidobacterium sp. ESL0690]WEV45995.1 hypothetical protein OZX62_05875 [Bifidobacterium sp. ESL0690]
MAQINNLPRLSVTGCVQKPVVPVDQWDESQIVVHPFFVVLTVGLARVVRYENGKEVHVGRYMKALVFRGIADDLQP